MSNNSISRNVVRITSNPNIVKVTALGARGLSAYQVAVANGFIGTEQDWLISLGQVHRSGVCGGVANGVNTIFSLPSIPQAQSLSVYRNGVRQSEVSDISVIGVLITFAFAPNSLDEITYNYAE